MIRRAASSIPPAGFSRSALTPNVAEATSRPMASEPENIEELSFEDALKRLEAIVHRLESGDASLDESIRLYAEGDALRAQCEARLQAAQARIEKITLGTDGKPAKLQPFDAG